MDINLTREYDDAGITRRFCAFLLDVVGVILPPLLLAYLFYRSNQLLMDALRLIAVPLAFTIYQTLCVYKGGQTAGGKIMGIRVVGVKNIAVPFHKALIRGIIMGVASEPMKFGVAGDIGLAICFLSILFPPNPKIRKRQHAFDLLVGTCVIKAHRTRNERFMTGVTNQMTKS